MKNNILILGGGYIGTHLNKVLNTSNTVTILTKGEINYNNSYHFKKYLSNNSYDYVINCSGFCGKPNVDQAEIEKEKCWELNVTGPTSVNSICRELSIPYIHVSSGCIYTGYDKLWAEKDTPNFGVFNNTSSFYSKSKHAYELSNSNYGLTIRIRMPFDNDVKCNRSILYKLLKYNNIIDFRNSKTYIPDLCSFIQSYILQQNNNNDIINFVNPDALFTKEVVDLLTEAGKVNYKWNYVSMDDLDITAGRSNCVLSTTKLIENYNYTPLTETTAIRKALNLH